MSLCWDERTMPYLQERKEIWYESQWVHAFSTGTEERSYYPLVSTCKKKKEALCCILKVHVEIQEFWCHSFSCQENAFDWDLIGLNIYWLVGGYWLRRDCWLRIDWWLIIDRWLITDCWMVRGCWLRRDCWLILDCWLITDFWLIRDWPLKNRLHVSALTPVIY